jgi:hypothetical protein
MPDLKLVSWDGNNINDGSNYSAGFTPGLEWGLPSVSARLAARESNWPVVAGVDRGERQMYVFVEIVGSSTRTLRDSLVRWFDPQDGDTKRLVIEDDDGSDDRYVDAVCVEFQPLIVRGVAHDRMFVATLVVSGDVRFRATSETSDNWNITATSETKAISNGGTDDAYPTYEFTPNSAKSGGQPYKRYITVDWRAPEPSRYWKGYPMRVGPIDTQTGSTNFDAADGSDIHLFIDGVESYRWVVSPNTASTYIWFIASFAAELTVALEDAIPSSGDIPNITASAEISQFPSEGILEIGTEQFYYTDKDDNTWQFTGVTRGVRNTAEAAHAAAATIRWIQHDIIITYGNSSDAVSSDYTDTDWEPVFDKSSSTNTSWVYSNFLKFDTSPTIWPRYDQPGAWNPSMNPGYSHVPITVRGTYGGTQRAAAGATCSVAGVFIQEELYGGDGVTNYTPNWVLHNNCGIVNAAWNQSANGQMRRATATYQARLLYWPRGDEGWTAQKTFDESDLASVDTWYTWTEAAAGSPWDEARALAIMLYYYDGDFEITDVTVTLSSTETPDVTINDDGTGEEVGNYQLDALLTNYELGESFSIVAVDTVNEEFEVSGDQTEYFRITAPVLVEGSTGNDGVWTVASVTYDSGTSRTIVEVNENVTNATADGTLRTGRTIRVQFEMALDETLTVDTDNGTVTHSNGDTSQYKAVSFPDGVETDWLPFVPGSNDLSFVDSGTADLDVDTSFEARYY